MGPRLVGLFGLSLIVAGLFSTDPAMGYPPDAPFKSAMTVHGLIHGLNAPVCFGLVTVSTIVLGRHFLCDPSSRWLDAASLAVGVMIVLSFAGATTCSVMDGTASGRMRPRVWCSGLGSRSAGSGSRLRLSGSGGPAVARTARRPASRPAQRPPRNVAHVVLDPHLVTPLAERYVPHLL